MTDPTTTAAATEAEDRALIVRLWRLQLRALVKRFESDEPLTAAELNVCRQWLADQGINRTSLNTLEPGSALGHLAGNLPSFDDPA